jgi:predicted CXXCH cytochrome family protein
VAARPHPHLTAPAAVVLAARLVSCGPSEVRDPDPAAYAGGAVCAGCHEREAVLWRSSDHARSMQPADSTTVLGDFGGVRVALDGVEFTFGLRGSRPVVTTTGGDGRPGRLEVAYTLGVTPLQQYLVRGPRGRLHALTAAWDARPAEQGGQHWFSLYPGARLEPGDALHWAGPAQTWNFMCAECHSTAVQKNFDPARDRYATAWSEINVSCEACHGPGARHVGWAQRAAAGTTGGQATSGLLSLGDTGVWRRPAGATTARRSDVPAFRAEVETCGRCHSRRSPVWPDVTPGQPLAQTHRVDLLLDGLYAPDGQQLGEVYEYGSFLQSRMYRAGVTCANCHDPHSGALRRPGNTLCTSCHEQATYDAERHHRHQPATAGSACVACHMPERTYMVVDRRRDHRFHVPRPGESVRFGAPDPCQACHAERGPARAAKTPAPLPGSAAVRRPAFTEAIWLGRARRGEAIPMLARLIADSLAPAIVRATALSLLTSYQGAPVLTAVARAARDGDPLVRRAAAAGLPALPPGSREGIGTPLLQDSIRTVRLEAVLPMAALPPPLRQGAVAAPLAAAMDEYRRAQRFNADRAEAHVNIGALEMLLGRTREAEVAFRTAIGLDRHFTPAYLGLADVQAEAGQERDAEATLRQGLDAAPDAAPLHHALGLALVRQRRHTDALPALATAMRLAPQEPRLAFVYAVALHDAGDRPGALRVLRDAATRFTADERIARTLRAYDAETARGRGRD